MYVKAKKLEPRRLAGPPVEHVVHDRERSFLDLLVEVSDDCLQRRGGGSATHRPVLNIPGASKNKNREVTRNGCIYTISSSPLHMSYVLRKTITKKTQTTINLKHTHLVLYFTFRNSSIEKIIIIMDHSFVVCLLPSWSQRRAR